MSSGKGNKIFTKLSNSDESGFSNLKKKKVPNIDFLWGILFSVCYSSAETKSFLFLLWRITASFKIGLQKHAGGKLWSCVIYVGVLRAVVYVFSEGED